MISSSWGFFALVNYVPEPLGSRLDAITQAFPGHDFRQAHITVLPPRPLRVPVDHASRYTRGILDRFTAFDVQLNAVQRFPATNVLYLDLTDGYETVHELHDALNTGDLAFEEQFEFHPHLTLAGPFTAEEVSSMQARANALWNAVEGRDKFKVTELVGLWAESDGKLLSWQRLWAHPLRMDHGRTASMSVTGRTS